MVLAKIASGGCVGLMLAALFVGLCTLFPAQTVAREAPQRGQGTCTLIVHVTGVRNQKGVIGGALFTSSQGWPEDESKAFARGPFPITGHTATLTFRQLPARRYGVVILHDENGNKKLDRNFLGIPKEGFGFANNPRVLLGPPSIDKAWVNVTCPTTETTINLIYK